ncbi:energy transducer TonB [Limnobacter parvus]|uniref:Energy transducer TonB n=1 Tax=Limnobacter parvus TaxID=2939690 RepID=A0ABT1XG00_9BURK|nr:energy transducer TonB [Limnobacter parvus]MCR2745518.1 energy transducer TonB [Limnobacter parvus]
MNTQSVSMSFSLNIHSQKLINTLTFAAVLLLHALGLVWAAQQLSITEPAITPPSVVGVLVAPEPVPAPPLPKAVPPSSKPEPKPVPKPKPVAKPTPEPKTEPAREVASEPVSPAAASVPAPAAPSMPPASPAPEALAPVTPPRTDAAHLNNPAPQYPALSRRLGEQGRVLLDVYILPNGNVGEIKLNQSSGFPRLDNAALQAVKTWKYVPAKRGDKPIPFWYVQPVSFVLNN